MTRRNSNRLTTNIFCGCDVLKNSYIFSLIGVILWGIVMANILIIGFVIILLPEETVLSYFLTWLIIVLMLHVFIICDGLIIYGYKKLLAWAYIPYLIINALEFIFGYIFIIILFVWGIFLPKTYDFDVSSLIESEFHARIICFMLAIVLIPFNLFRHWKWYIVFRAYKYIKQLSDNEKPPAYEEVQVLNEKIEMDTKR